MNKTKYSVQLNRIRKYCKAAILTCSFVAVNSAIAQQKNDKEPALPALNDLKESVLSPSLLQLLPQNTQPPSFAPSLSPILEMPDITIDGKPLPPSVAIVDTIDTLPATSLPVQGEFIPLRIVLNLAVAPEFVVEELENLGMNSITYRGKLLTGVLPISQVSNLQSIDGIANIRPAFAGVRSGLITTQGDQAANADLARAISGLSGNGIKIGVLSDSYDCFNQAASDISNGDLPDASLIDILDDTVCGNFVKDEGRAMFQIAHDMAPGADLAFHTAFKGELDYAEGIDQLVTAGADIIVDDVFYYEEPFFQDGVIAQAATNAVVVSDVPYFTAAGNAGRYSWEGSYASSGQSFISTNGDAHEFAPGDIQQSITVLPTSFVAIVLQWDDPYSTLDPNGLAGPDTDLDIALVNSSGNIVATGVDNNIAGDPYEVIFYLNNSGSQQFNLVIEKQVGPEPNLMKWIAFSGLASIDEHDTASGTVVGHANAEAVLSIGAVNYDKTPRYGISPPQLASYSSGGASEILFLADGTSINPPIIRNNPDVTAPDGGNNTVVGSDSDGDNFPNFFGTSAAVVHAASVAALLLEKESLTPSTIENILETTAISHGNSGYSPDTGNGFIDAASALATQLEPPSISSPGAGVSQTGPTIQIDWIANELTPDSWQVFVGSTLPNNGVFSNDLFSSEVLSSSTDSVLANGLPEDGTTVYITLEWNYGNSSEFTTIEIVTSTPTPPSLTSPTPGTSFPLEGSAVPVMWSHGSAQVDSWQLTIGTTGPQSSDIFSSGSLAGSEFGTTATGLPLSGQTLYFTLEYTIDDIVQSLDYIFIADNFSSSITIPRGQWHLISIPAKSNQTFSDFFSPQLDPADFNNLNSLTPWIAYYRFDPDLFHLQTGLPGYYELVDLNESLGGLFESFWLMHLSPSPIELELPTDAIHASGIDTLECAPGYFCETISLAANNNESGGWTMVAIPSSLEPEVRDLRIHTPNSGTACGIGCDLNEAEAEGWGANFSWTYAPSVSGGYGSYIANENSDIIPSWTGFFISTTPQGVAESAELELPVR